MRPGTSALLCALGLLCACQASAPPPPVARATAPRRAPPPPAAPPRDRGEEVAAAALRRYLLHLLPCNRDGGELELLVSLAPDGAVRDVQGGASSVPPQTLRCVAERVARWRFPDQRQVALPLHLPLTFPLPTPSLSAHGAVLAEGGPIDVAAVERELRRLQPRLLACLRSRREPALLLSLRLGAFGRFLGHQLEAEGAESVPLSKGKRDKERGCLKRVLRLGRFPNPDAPAELRYPLVLPPPSP